MVGCLAIGHIDAEGMVAVDQASAVVTQAEPTVCVLGDGYHGARFGCMGLPWPPSGRKRIEIFRRAVRHRARGGWSRSARAKAHSTRKGEQGGRCATPVALRAKIQGARGIRHGQGYQLQPEAMGGAARSIADGDLPIDNNWVENQIRPIALGRSNWLFAGSLRAGQRAAAIMSLVHSARINGLEPHT